MQGPPVYGHSSTVGATVGTETGVSAGVGTNVGRVLDGVCSGVEVLVVDATIVGAVEVEDAAAAAV